MKKIALDSLAILAQDSEVAQMLRSFDWTRSTLGAPESWPPTLIALVNNILASKVPMMVSWGPSLLSIYNDAYRLQFLGNKHPAALCQPYQTIWPELWPYLEPVIERGWAGEATFFENALFTFEQSGYQEQVWATFSHSPVFDAGVVEPDRDFERRLGVSQARLV